MVDSGGKTRILTKKHWNRCRTINLLIRGSGIHARIHLILPVRKVRKKVQAYNSIFMFSYIQHLRAHEIKRYLRAIKYNAIKNKFYNEWFFSSQVLSGLKNIKWCAFTAMAVLSVWLWQDNKRYISNERNILWYCNRTKFEEHHICIQSVTLKLVYKRSLLFHG